tara:strand:+ start:295 stop:510 length:216 start_codon:yes stop_codon:yes gene_type:complete
MRKLLTIIALSAFLSGVAYAEPKGNVIADKINAVGAFVNSEIEKTKEFQKKNWAMMKTDITKLFQKIGLVK